MNAEHASIASVPAKSSAHRALFCASLAHGESILYPVCECADTAASIRCLQGAGLSQIVRTDDRWEVSGRQGAICEPIIDAGESGTTIRFILPLLFDEKPHKIRGSGRLLTRPLTPYKPYCSEWKIESDYLAFQGELKSGEHVLPGNVSSQFVSGLLMSLATLEENSTLRLIPPIESRGYIDLTLSVMRSFGIQVERPEDNTFNIIGGMKYKPCSFMIEGDWSYAAALLAIGCNLNGIIISGLDPKSLQPDRAICNILSQAGASLSWEQNCLHLSAGDLYSITVDVSQTPDITPALAALLCTTGGVSQIINASRLRLKESDRLHALTVMLQGLGADITEGNDSLTIRGQTILKGGAANAMGDHRIAMAAAIAALKCREPVILKGGSCVEKSAPDFWHVYNESEGAKHVIHVG